MKAIAIYTRRVLERTGFRKWAYKEAQQTTIVLGGREIASNHLERIGNPRLRIKFEKVLETRSKKELVAFVERLGMSSHDKWLRAELAGIIGKEVR